MPCSDVIGLERTALHWLGKRRKGPDRGAMRQIKRRSDKAIGEGDRCARSPRPLGGGTALAGVERKGRQSSAPDSTGPAEQARTARHRPGLVSSGKERQASHGQESKGVACLAVTSKAEPWNRRRGRKAMQGDASERPGS